MDTDKGKVTDIIGWSDFGGVLNVKTDARNARKDSHISTLNWLIEVYMKTVTSDILLVDIVLEDELLLWTTEPHSNDRTKR